MQSNLLRVASLEVGEINHDADKVALFAIIILITIIIDNVVTPILQAHWEVIKHAAVVRVGEDVVEWYVSEWLRWTAYLLQNMILCLLRVDHKVVVLLCVLILCCKPLPV